MLLRCSNEKDFLKAVTSLLRGADSTISLKNILTLGQILKSANRPPRYTV